MKSNNSGYRAQPVQAMENTGKRIELFQIVLYKDGMIAFHPYQNERFENQKAAEDRIAELPEETSKR
ncbi:MAG: hypothetical protein CML69_06770 [Rhodobacteraceae bacterium]|nr:hypothetical protein [Paracoccaceae bacterium]|tara:strand:+ start:43 stop:243 length:201 start_codon:yes stop_codon:yes gene_type:complete